ncbi:MAG TPA: hypothetical protein DCF65_09100 [Chloroflexi bacterium]|nr:hypothetical protein [Chloroflexota bacterium]HAF19480.1 hypothetical protein [Chloroflexota bacterium]
MEQDVIKVDRAMWAFWIAAALAAVGAVAPLSFSIGAHSRLQWVIVPFGIAAVVLGINAVMYHQGRSLAATLYFVAGLAIVYGILAMVAVPLRLAVIGTCPLAPARCPLGYEPPLTSAENSGLALASFCGVLAIFVGFYGLLMLYRRLGVRPRQGLLWPAKPPAQPAPPAQVAPVAAVPVVAAPVVAAPAEAAPAPVEPVPVEAAPVEAAPAPAAPRVARSRTRPRATARPPAADEPKELPAPDEPKELPAPAEPEELPPPG